MSQNKRIKEALKLLDGIQHQIPRKTYLSLLDAISTQETAEPASKVEAEKFLRERDKLNILKDGTVGHLIAVNAVRAALYTNPQPLPEQAQELSDAQVMDIALKARRGMSSEVERDYIKQVPFPAMRNFVRSLMGKTS